MRAEAISLDPPPLAVSVEGDAVKLHPMVDEAEAELLGDPPLKRLQLLVHELHDIAGFDVDEMVVMLVRGGLVAGAPVAEFVAFQDARFLEQANGPIDRRDRNPGIDRRRPLVKRLDVGMVFGLRQDPRDHPSLLGDPQALVRAQRFDVDDCVAHDKKVGASAAAVKGRGA